MRLLLILPTMFLSVTALSGCDGSGGEKVVPTYKGMTISGNTYTRKLASLLEDSSSNSNSTSEEQPSLEGDVEDIVGIDVVDDNETKYFVNPSEKFIIEVHIDNPNDFEIQSFTLNGEKYANYMFKEGSTMELLLLETTAPSTSGYIEYTIDAIKYIDGTEIKDVDMSSANKTIGAGVKYTNAPTAKVNNQTIGVNKAAFTISVTDANQLIGENELKAYLTDGKEVVATKDLVVGNNELAFSDLFVNESYELGVAAVFDQVGGKGLHADWLLTKAFRTQSLYTLDDFDVDDSSIKADINKVDSTVTSEITSVELFKGEQLVKTNSNNLVGFDGLDSFADYKVVFKYSYTKGDTVVNQEISKEVKTSPYLEFVSCRIINTSAVSEGDTIYMQANIVNPYNTTPKSAVVNGETYNCTGSTSATRIYLEIINNGQFKGGLTELTVEKVNMSIEGKDYSIVARDNNKDSIYINGIIAINSIEYVNEEAKPIDYYFEGDDLFFLVTLDNETGYDIDDFVFLTGTGWDTPITPSFTKLDNSRYLLDVSSDPGAYRKFGEIHYHNEYVSNGKLKGVDVPAMPMKLNGTVEISTVDDLINTNYTSGYYYKLMNDINLSGVAWNHSLSDNFQGSIFDGNNHSIKNLSNVSSVDASPNFSLFNSIHGGKVKNLKLEDVLIMSTLTGEGSIVYGGIAGIIFDGTIIENCSVTGDISFANKNTNTGFDFVRIGGIVGGFGYGKSIINDCSVNVNITYTSSTAIKGYVGGITSLHNYGINNDGMVISNCDVKGSLNGDYAHPVINNFEQMSRATNCVFDNNTFDALVNGVKMVQKAEE